MARNRRCQTVAARFGPALYALLFCGLIGGSALGYVWQKDQIRKLGLQVTAREWKRDQLRQENEKRRNQLAALRSPKYLESRIKELNLGLAEAQPTQIWRLSEPLPEPIRTNSQYAARNEGLAPIQ